MPLSRINTNSISDGTVIASDILDGTISSSKLVASNIAGDRLAANTLANSVFQTGSVENYLNAQSGGALGMRNRIINGAMVIDQRNSGAAVTPADSAFTLDRWSVQASQSSKFTVQQDSSANTVAGFSSSLKVTSLSSYSITSGDYFLVTQKIEGNNLKDIQWGTASAAPVTLSFWIRSSLTGTFGVILTNSAENRFYPASYTIVAADTWEKKTITISGDTSGTWLANTSTGIRISFGLGVGSTYSFTAGSWTSSSSYGTSGATSVVGTNGATWYVTGVQVEKGSIATPFEYRQYGTELALCQRYYEKVVTGSGSPGNSFLSGVLTGGNCTHTCYFKTTKRANPSWAAVNGATWQNTPNNSMTSPEQAVFQNTSSGYFYLGVNPGDGIEFSAEL